ncbi:unnamed protein product [Microthlaspi erraticum]|uniref:Glycine-rich protein n=1 Tax=Microthlaspi erraticum TaxID=1685480 RepID=A0A6D2IP69_9BRAS|nr:unnamed protein product [Microthlaspi erraticum]
MTTKLNLLFTFLLLTLTLSHSRLTRPESSGSVSNELKKNSKGNNNKNDKGYGSPGGYFPPGTNFGIPGFSGKDWGNIGGGYGGGYGGPSGGHDKNGVVRPTKVCKEKGHCFMKKLTCPAKCFKSFSSSGKGYGGGGGGGCCTIDCKKKCVAFC